MSRWVYRHAVSRNGNERLLTVNHALGIHSLSWVASYYVTSLSAVDIVAPFGKK